jgi:uncharacterized repeat protein (TIGR01451 family)
LGRNVVVGQNRIAAVALAGVVLGCLIPTGLGQEKGKGPPPPVPASGMSDLPPLPEPADGPQPAPAPTPPTAPGSFPGPVNKEAQPIIPAPAPAAEPGSNFATTPRTPEQPLGRPPAFRVLVPTTHAETTTTQYSSNQYSSAAPPADIPVVTAAQVPVLTLEKKGPGSVALGQPLLYDIIVRNIGTVLAHQVRVDDELPPGTRVLGAEPTAGMTAQGDHLSWVVDLPAGSERRFRVQVQPSAAGDWQGNASASVMVSVASGLHTQVTPRSAPVPAAARLSISLTGPDSAGVGQPAVFQIRVSNNGTQPLRGLVLRDHVPPGLQHPAGTELEADLGTLEPGKTKNITLTTRAVQPGRFVNAVVVMGDGQQAEARAAIQIVGAARPPH